MGSKLFKPTFDWIKNDFRAYPLRFIVEVIAWAISIGCALVMSITVPDSPFHILYPLWISGSAMYAWAAYSRGSFGLLANYMLLVGIDSTALLRLIIT